MLAIHALNSENEDVQSRSSMISRQSTMDGKMKGLDGEMNPFYEDPGFQEERIMTKVKKHFYTLSLFSIHIGAAFLLRYISFKYFR